MKRNSHATDHPVDALPEYVRGTSADPESIERHLAGCEACRVELDTVRALAADTPAPLTDIERRVAYRSFEARRVRAGRARPAWLAATWRAAAGMALLLTSVGVWRVLDGGGSASEWNPDAAVEAFRRDIADLDVDGADVRAALGAGLLDDPGNPWMDYEAAAQGDPRPPWEEER